MNLAKLGTAQLRKAIEAGKVPAEQLEAAQQLLAVRESTDKSSKKTAAKKTAEKKPAKKVAAPKKAAKKEVAKKVPAKKAAAPKKEKAEKTTERKAREPKTSLDEYQKDGVSGLVRKLLIGDGSSKTAAVTFSEAKKAVEKKFGRALHTSEFDRNFKVLVNLGHLKDKKKVEYKSIAKKDGGK